MLSLLLGARTEELRPLTWDHVDLDGDPEVAAHVSAADSVRRGAPCPSGKKPHGKQPERHGGFTTGCSPPRSATSRTRTTSGARSAGWSRPPGSTRSSGRPERCGTASSILAEASVSIEDINRLVGNSGTAVTEAVYRKQIRPVIEQAARAMDRVVPAAG